MPENRSWYYIQDAKYYTIQSLYFKEICKKHLFRLSRIIVTSLYLSEPFIGICMLFMVTSPLHLV